MTIDSLAAEIKKTSSEEVVQRLGDLLLEWKEDDRTVEALTSDVERYIGYTWISTDELHNRVYYLWSQFRNDSILGIQGMTMNERLFTFGLISRFDAASTAGSREVLYAKLLARA